MNQDSSSLKVLLAAIAQSPIVMPELASRLPAGFSEVDAAILAWIAAEGRRIGRRFPLM